MTIFNIFNIVIGLLRYSSICLIGFFSKVLSIQIGFCVTWALQPWHANTHTHTHTHTHTPLFPWSLHVHTWLYTSSDPPPPSFRGGLAPRSDRDTPRSVISVSNSSYQKKEKKGGKRAKSHRATLCLHEYYRDTRERVTNVSNSSYLKKKKGTQYRRVTLCFQRKDPYYENFHTYVYT